MVRMFANGPGDRGLIPGRVIQKIQKMVLDTFLLDKCGSHRKRRVLWSPLTTVCQLTIYIYIYILGRIINNFRFIKI